MDEKKIRVAKVPGSKSMTNRALLLAALSDREYLLEGAQFSEDSHYFLEALKMLGFCVQSSEAEETVRIKGAGGRIPNRYADIYVGSAGTAARFLTAMLAFSDGIYTIRASEQMIRRPMRALFDALESLGAAFCYLGEPGYLPVQVRGVFSQGKKESTSGFFMGEPSTNKEMPYEQAPGPRETVIDISESTQYLSALLMTADMLPEGLCIQVTGRKKTGSYIEITRRMMADFGIVTEFDGETYTVMPGHNGVSGIMMPGHNGVSGIMMPGHNGTSGEVMYGPNVTAGVTSSETEGVGQSAAAGEETVTLPAEAAGFYRIEPDVSAACYFYAAAMLTGESVLVRHVYGTSIQGDMKFITLLEQMGARVEERPEGICLTGPESFPGVDVDMNDFSDQAITLAALAPFAGSPTRIRGIAHIRRQESDRLHGMAENLTRMGIRVDEGEDEIRIWPGSPVPCEIETYDDHRMAMGFALTGLKVPGVVIKNPGCCKKTFKEYFSEMEKVFGLTL